MNKEPEYKDNQDLAEILRVDTSSPVRPALSIDWDLYGRYLEESDLSDDQKREFIETLWNIMVSFVDLGFGLHPLQQACEHKHDLSQLEPSDVLGSTRSLSHKVFLKAADNPEKDHAERSES